MKSPPCTLAHLGFSSGTKNIDRTQLWTIQYDKTKKENNLHSSMLGYSIPCHNFIA